MGEGAVVDHVGGGDQVVGVVAHGDHRAVVHQGNVVGQHGARLERQLATGCDGQRPRPVAVDAHPQ